MYYVLWWIGIRNTNAFCMISWGWTEHLIPLNGPVCAGWGKNQPCTGSTKTLIGERSFFREIITMDAFAPLQNRDSVYGPLPVRSQLLWVVLDYEPAVKVGAGYGGRSHFLSSCDTNAGISTRSRMKQIPSYPPLMPHTATTASNGYTSSIR